MGKVQELDKSGAGLLEGLDSMVAVGQAPWHYSYNEALVRLHGEGTKITSAEINAAAGIDWEVNQVNVNSMLQSPYQALAGDLVNVRSDNNLILGYVSKSYRPFQNADAPVFLDSLIDSGELLYETAGSLHGGRRVWWLVKMPQSITIGGDMDETVETYLLLMNSHDGSVSVTVAVTPIRVVCQNTLAWSLRDAVRMARIKHTKNAADKFAEARRTLEIGYKYQEEFEVIGNQLVQTSFSDAQFEEFLNDVMPIPEPTFRDTNIVGENGEVVTVKRQSNQPAITAVKKQHNQIVDIYYNHPTQLRVKGTLWGAVQAMSFFADHVLTADSTDENRFKSVIKGSPGKSLSPRAFQRALELV